jgi:hypothetical protein
VLWFLPIPLLFVAAPAIWVGRLAVSSCTLTPVDCACHNTTAVPHLAAGDAYKFSLSRLHSLRDIFFYFFSLDAGYCTWNSSDVCCLRDGMEAV